MTVFKYIIPFLLFCTGISAQASPPKQVPAEVVKLNPKLDKNSLKKVFIIYNLTTESFAEALYTGTKFLAGNSNILFVPVFINSVTDQKSTLTFENNLPVQTLRSFDNGGYKSFNLQESDLPILVAYDENNDLCGFSKTVEDLVKIDCLNNPTPGKFLRLKVLTEDKAKQVQPYANKKIYVLNGSKTATLSVAMTNNFGDFEYKVTDETQDYVLQIPEKMESVNFVILATQSGRIVGKFDKTEDGFEYKLLKADLVKLPDLAPEEDVDVQLTQLEQTKSRDFTITENLFYELGRSTLLPESKDLLDKILQVLKMKPNFKLVIISHTDSQGDDMDNLKLSESRSNAVIDYFVSKGIKKSILKGIGKGESEIRNRCTNGIECSDKEHEYNRRTEFKFIKS